MSSPEGSKEERSRYALVYIAKSIYRTTVIKRNVLLLLDDGKGLALNKNQ